MALVGQSHRRGTNWSASSASRRNCQVSIAVSSTPASRPHRVDIPRRTCAPLFRSWPVTATSAPNGEKFINTKASSTLGGKIDEHDDKSDARPVEDPLARINPASSASERTPRLNYRSSRRSRYICLPIIINNQERLERRGQLTTKDRITRETKNKRPVGARAHL